LQPRDRKIEFYKSGLGGCGLGENFAAARIGEGEANLDWQLTLPGKEQFLTHHGWNGLWSRGPLTPLDNAISI